MERGAKQGDIFSPLLSKALLEEALSKWKVRIAGMSWKFCACKNLTNVRYADDLLLYTSSWRDLVFMMANLQPKLQKYSLEMIVLKSNKDQNAIMR